MLRGTGRHYQSLLAQTTFESRALVQSAKAEALLAWGKQLTWSGEPDIHCQQAALFPGRLCLRRFADTSALLIARSGSQMRWQSGRVSGGSVHFNPHGWSDFCPRKEASQCQLP